MPVLTTRKAPALFGCPWSDCSKTFTRKFNLDSHLRAHRGEKPFSCLLCGRAFTRKNDLISHGREMHEKDLQFKCTVCGRLFNRRRNRLRHESSCTIRNTKRQREAPQNKESVRTLQDVIEGITVASPRNLSVSEGSQHDESDSREVQTLLASSQASSPTPTESDKSVGDGVSDSEKEWDEWNEWRSSQPFQKRREEGIQATMAYICATARLDILRDANSADVETGDDAWPTWVPNLYENTGLPPNPNDLKYAGCNACGTRTKVDPIPNRLSKCLKVRGVVFDVIKDVFCPWSMNDWRKPPFELADSRTSFFQTDAKYFTGDRLVDVFTYVNSSPLRHTALMQKLDISPQILNGAAIMLRDWLKARSIISAQQDDQTFLSVDAMEIRNLRLSKLSWPMHPEGFVTRRGYLGSLRKIAGVKPGDVCCVLFGCGVPLILRPEGDHFRLAGQAYIHGAMKGEIIDYLNAGQLEERMFKIR